MAGLKDILPDKRRVTVLVSLSFLLAIFMVPYFFVFIPANADNIKRQAFLKLDRAAQNIISKSEDTHNYFRITNTGTICIDSEEMSMAECSSMGKERLSFRDSVYFMSRDSGWNILFIQPPSLYEDDPVDSCDSIHAHELPVHDFIAPCLASGKEVFDAFLLLHYCRQLGKDTIAKILYQDFQTGLEQDIDLDSLSPRHNGMRSPDMSDISLRSTDYKLFTYPFLLGQHRMVICGLMKTEVYNTKTPYYSCWCFLLLVICLVLFLLSLPFLKIFMMNVNDRISAMNVAIGIVFLFLTASFVTIISTQLILHNSSQGEGTGTRKPRIPFRKTRRFAELRIN